MKMSAMKLKKTLIYLFLAVFTFVQIFPFYWLVTFSFKSNTEIFDSNNLVGLPKVWHFGNYSKALMGGEILRYLLNSVFYAAVTVVVSTLLASMVAYAINRMYWKAKGIVAAIFSLGIMIPVQATLLPLFQGLDRLGIRGGYLGLMLPYITFAMPMTVMILRYTADSSDLSVTEQTGSGEFYSWSCKRLNSEHKEKLYFLIRGSWTRRCSFFFRV